MILGTPCAAPCLSPGALDREAYSTTYYPLVPWVLAIMLLKLFQLRAADINGEKTIESRAGQKLNFTTNNIEHLLWHSLLSIPYFFQLFGEAFSDHPFKIARPPHAVTPYSPSPLLFPHGSCHLLTYCMFCLAAMWTVCSSQENISSPKADSVVSCVIIVSPAPRRVFSTW